MHDGLLVRGPSRIENLVQNGPRGAILPGRAEVVQEGVGLAKRRLRVIFREPGVVMLELVLRGSAGDEPGELRIDIGRLESARFRAPRPVKILREHLKKKRDRAAQQFAQAAGEFSLEGHAAVGKHEHDEPLDLPWCQVRERFVVKIVDAIQQPQAIKRRGKVDGSAEQPADVILFWRGAAPLGAKPRKKIAEQLRVVLPQVEQHVRKFVDADIDAGAPSRWSYRSDAVPLAAHAWTPMFPISDR